MPRSNAAPRKPAAPRLPRFSPTRIALYLFCPRAYYFYYVRGLKWGGVRAGHTFGSNMHRALQEFHNQGGAAQVSLDDLLTHLRERWSDAGFGSAEEADEHLTHGEAMLARYYVAQEPGRETVGTELTVSHRYDDFVLFGKIDRLDRRPDGALEVVDYKSGRWEITEAEVRESLPMRVYQLVVARQHPGVPVYSTIVALRSGAIASTLRTASELDDVEREVSETVRAILRDERMLAVPGEQCRDCVYPRVCPPGRNWLRAHPANGES